MIIMNELDQYQFVSIGSGKVFAQEYPDEVSAVYGQQHGDMWVSKITSAKKGEADYFDVLVAHMFMSGWLCVHKETGETKRY